MKRSLIVIALAASALLGGVAQTLAIGASTAEQQNVAGLRACGLVAEAKALGVSTTRIPLTAQLCRFYRIQVIAHGGY